MITDCLFNTLQFSDIYTIIKCLNVKQYNSSINTEYFWKCLCERDYKNDYQTTNSQTYYQKYKQCHIYTSCNTDFEYGRMYQLVMDKTKRILPSYGRRYRILDWMEMQSKEKIIQEANYIISNHNYKRHRHIYNEFAKLKLKEPLEYKDDFYLGRCVQFILDTNNKITSKEIFENDREEIVNLAHEMKAKILYPKVNDVYKVDCDECYVWYYGNKRCSCGNRRYSLYVLDTVNSLDDTELTSYPEHY